MLLKATDEQLNVLKIYSNVQQKSIAMENIPEQFRPEMPDD